MKEFHIDFLLAYLEYLNILWIGDGNKVSERPCEPSFQSLEKYAGIKGYVIRNTRCSKC